VGGPAWLSDVLAGGVLAIAGYSAARLLAAAAWRRASERDVDAFHLVMGVSMAGMLTGDVTAFAAKVWAVVFACSTVWFASRLPWAVTVGAGGSPSLGHHLFNVVSSGAMVYMLLAMGAGSGGSLMRGMAAAGGGSAHLPFLAAVLAAVLFAGALIEANRSFRPAARRPLLTALESGPGGPPELDLSVGTPMAMSAPNLVETRRAPNRMSLVQGSPPAVLAPHLAAASQVAMGLVMAYMLVTMV
jgi:hypothetical protein